ncbi:MAG: helix-turn-helix domain-containing protein [Acidimicrobiia bacterium]
MTAATAVQVQARALGDPTRHEIFRYVAASADAVDVAELTGHFGLNHNAIRQHLAKLVDAGLVVEERAPATGRGRRRLHYRLDPAAESRWGVTGPYERLSLLLSEIIRTGETAVEIGRRAGRRERPHAGAADDPVTAMVDHMKRQGFDPVVHRHGDDVEVTLRTCPFETIAVADPDTVCGLHLGIAYGAAEAAGGIVVDELVPNDPRRAHCRLRCHLSAAS